MAVNETTDLCRVPVPARMMWFILVPVSTMMRSA